MNISRKQTAQSGFTLVELAIVMVIIGLLIGGILKGQELIRNAAVSATAAKLKAFEVALVTFADIYKGKPGDITSAQLKIVGCDATVGCENGNGDGLIRNNQSIVTNALRTETGINGEQFQAMKHLALADLIGGVDPAATGPTVDDNYVKSDLNGFLYIGESYGSYNSTWTGNAPIPSGILIGQTPATYTWAGTGNGVEPALLARLDGKIDDGSATSGNFHATGAADCFNGRDYNVQEEERQCNFVYKAK